MKLPRKSIIPGGAITDSRLKGRDLQVLCLIGCYNEERGWWYVSHLEMSNMLHCSRSTVQRSLERLIDATWVETKTTEVSYGSRRYASYAYRTVLDTPHPDSEPTRSQVEAQIADDDAHRRARNCGEVPADGHGAQNRGHGAQPYVGSKESYDSKIDDDDDTRTQDLSGFPEEVLSLTSEIISIAGLNPQRHTFEAAGFVQAFLSSGYTREHLLAGTRECMARKPDGPPNSINYFRKPWQMAKTKAEMPVPQSDVSRQTNGGRRERRDEAASVIRQLEEESARSDPDGEAESGGLGGASIQRIPLPKFG